MVCFQLFTSTMSNFDPIHTNHLAKDRPVILVDYRGVGRSGGKMPDSMPAIAADLIAFVKALGLKEIDLFAFLDRRHDRAADSCLTRAGLVRQDPPRGHRPFGRAKACEEFSREVMDIVNRPNSTIQGRTLDLFFSKSPASLRGGQGLARADRRAKAGPRGQKRGRRSPRPSSSLLLNGV